MRADAALWVRTCQACQRNKASSPCPAGVLQPLPIPSRRWESVSLDFITQLPKTLSGNTQILVFVDRLTKQTHLSALPPSATALDVAKDFLHNVFRLHGLPLNLVSDRDAKFTSAIWKEIMRLLGTQLRMSSAFHPQTDGQTERMHLVLKDMLRHLYGTHQSAGDSVLDLAEFAINNAYSAST